MSFNVSSLTFWQGVKFGLSAVIPQDDVERMLAVIYERHDFKEDLLQVEIRPNLKSQKRLQQQQSRRVNVYFGRRAVSCKEREVT